MMAPVEQREVLRCDHCNLVQFRTANAMCRRCHKCLEVELPEPEPAQMALVQAQPEKQEGLQVATAVRDLRHVRNLSQRQLAARMGVPRTYISKIENGKAMPTLSSLDRLARALKVDIASLLRDATNRHSEETAKDPEQDRGYRPSAGPVPADCRLNMRVRRRPGGQP